MILGTPEPKFALCHPDCVQGRAVKGAMPAGYEPAREWFKPGIHARRKPQGQPAPQVDQTRLLTELREVVAYTVAPKGDN